MAHGIACLQSGDGLNLWIPLAIDDRTVALSLAQQGWLVRHGDAFKVQEEACGIRVTVSTMERSQCEQFARDFKQCLS